MAGESSAKQQKTVTVISAKDAEGVFGPQGQQLVPVVSTPQSGSSAISACVVHMPPGRISRPHYHDHSEIIVVCVEGYAATLTGPEQTPVFHGPGEFIYIPEGVIHTAVNLSTDNRLIAFETRTDPMFNEDVIMSPEVVATAEKVAAELQEKFAKGELDVPAHWDTTNFKPYDFEEDPAK
jgi:uncharacterized RmlC-like cupin family protein